MIILFHKKSDKNCEKARNCDEKNVDEEKIMTKKCGDEK